MSLLLSQLGTGFDPAFMAAMNRPERIIVFEQPQVVASGMTPPDQVVP